MKNLWTRVKNTGKVMMALGGILILYDAGATGLKDIKGSIFYNERPYFPDYVEDLPRNLLAGGVGFGLYAFGKFKGRKKKKKEE